MSPLLKICKQTRWQPGTFFHGLCVYILNPFPNKPWFLRVCSSRLLKTLWEKEKLLGTNNFSFSHSVWYLFEELSAIFIRLKLLSANSLSFGKVLNLLFGKGLTNVTSSKAVLKFLRKHGRLMKQTITF